MSINKVIVNVVVVVVVDAAAAATAERLHSRDSTEQITLSEEEKNRPSIIWLSLS